LKRKGLDYSGIKTLGFWEVVDYYHISFEEVSLMGGFFPLAPTPLYTFAIFYS
jgi:hypothetical protein